MSESPPTVAESPPADRTKAPSQLVAEHLGRIIGRLQAEFLAGSAPTAWAQATLAKLRTGDINDPGGSPISWQLIFEDLPESLAGRGDEASKGERVIHQVLSLYAVHQQGRRPYAMHVAGRSLGRAARDLAWIDHAAQANAGVVSRFHRLSSTTDESLRLGHLRSLITMLRSERVSLDHAMLGRDLYQLLHPGTHTRVQLRWARDFHYRPPKKTDDQQNDTATNEPIKETQP